MNADRLKQELEMIESTINNLQHDVQHIASRIESLQFIRAALIATYGTKQEGFIQ